MLADKFSKRNYTRLRTWKTDLCAIPRAGWSVQVTKRQVKSALGKEARRISSGGKDIYW